MASLVSAGVSVTVTNESFFIPAAAATVPLFFIATADEKVQPDGITPAAGTYESNVVRTVTSLKQSTQLYGVPTFLTDGSGSPQHGDVRNEYGVFALNQYLGLGSMAYAVRANINLNDDLTDIRTMWDSAMGITTGAAAVLETLATSYISEWNTTNGVTPGTPDATIVTTHNLVGKAPNTPATAGHQAAHFTVAPVGGSASGLLADTPATHGHQNVHFTVAPTGGASSGLAADTAATHGHATLAFTGTTAVDPTTLLGIAGGSYDFKVAIGGAGAVTYTVVATGSDTMTSMAALMTAQTTAVASVAAVGNAFVVTDNLTGATSTVVVTAGTVNPDLFGAIDTALTDTHTNVSVGGADLVVHTYTASATIDGTHVQPISVVGTVGSGDTFAGVLAQITTALSSYGSVAIVGNDIVITSTSTGASSTVAITDTTLFAALTSYASITAAVGGANIVVHTYTASVLVDGTHTQAISIAGTVGTGDTFTNVLAQLTTQLAGFATVAIVGNDIVITSATTGTGSTVAITDTTLFAQLTSFGSITSAVAGTAIVTHAYTPASGTFTYTNVPLTGGSGTGATANITVTSGSVSAVVIVDGGTGYVVGDVLSATSASPFSTTGSGFSVTVLTVISYKTTLTAAEFLQLSASATQSVWAKSSFATLSTDFLNDHTLAPYPVYPSGYDHPAVPPAFAGLAGIAAATSPAEWLPIDAANALVGAADSFKFTVQFLNKTSLGSNDTARRSAVVTALRAIVNSNEDIRSETYEYNLILCPGFPELANNMLNLSLDISEEALVIADTPFDKDPDTVVTWAGTTARTTSQNVTYYYPHGLSTNLDGKTVVCAASGVALATITYSDNVSELWFAPAGTQRGMVSAATDVGYVSGTLGAATTFVPVALNQGQRDNLYKYFTNINPIVFFPGRGLIVWGQKTSAPAASALDRINVMRLVMYVRRQLRKNTMPFVFEPNDQLTRNNLKAAVDGFLGDLIVKRGLYDFVTVCDASNNTPDRIDRNEMYIDVALKPVKAAEFIYIPIRIVATGAKLTG